MRDPTSYGTGYCGSLAALYGDPNVNPQSGGLIGYPQIGQRFDLKQRQTERVLHGPHGEGIVRWFADIPATHVNTADEIIRLHKLDVSEARRQARLGGRPTDVSGGSGPWHAPAPALPLPPDPNGSDSA